MTLGNSVSAQVNLLHASQWICQRLLSLLCDKRPSAINVLCSVARAMTFLKPTYSIFDTFGVFVYPISFPTDIPSHKRDTFSKSRSGRKIPINLNLSGIPPLISNRKHPLGILYFFVIKPLSDNNFSTLSRTRPSFCVKPIIAALLLQICPSPS